MEELSATPPLFWACISMLHSNNVHLFGRCVHLFSALLKRLDVTSAGVQQLLLANLPQARV